MKTRHICIFIFSFLFSSISAQDTLSSKKNARFTRWQVGVDVLNAAISTFSPRKTAQVSVLTNVAPRWETVAELGFQRNNYQKNNYDATAQGLFAKLGGQYILVQDPESDVNCVYAGLKLAVAAYRQEYKSVPVRGSGTNTSQVAYEPSNQLSFWAEGAAGGRVQLFDSKVILDMTVQPRILVGGTKQEDIQPMIVPGFGRSSGKFTIGFSWSVGYRF